MGCKLLNVLGLLVFETSRSIKANVTRLTITFVAVILPVTFMKLHPSTAVSDANLQSSKIKRGYLLATVAAQPHNGKFNWVNAPPGPPTNVPDTVTYERAAAILPSFCKDWEQKLHDRQEYNQAHLEWREDRGYVTSSYVGYGKIESCQCKLSGGRPVGELKYKILSYYLVGHTVDEAKRAKPLLYGVTDTLEIFAWHGDK
ncbi:MAG TPA: hypothetical protein VJ728_00160, partial [Candidatus Binataceae bacterium]|nr:hypothetical protein [Candidatus Binataceae bacterium]